MPVASELELQPVDLELLVVASELELQPVDLKYVMFMKA